MPKQRATTTSERRKSEAASPAPTMALQPYRAEGDAADEAYPISEELRRAACEARAEAALPGRDRQPETHYVPLTLLVPASYNPRRISDFQLEQLRESLNKHGQLQALIVNTYPGREGVIVGGHQRLKILVADHFPKAGVVWVYETPSAEKALNLTLNQVGGEFDPDLLAKVLAELHDEAPELLPGTGFEADEIDKLLASLQNGQDGHGPGGDPDQDDIELPTGDTRVQPGDLWQLGRHKLYCGDATDWLSWLALLSLDGTPEALEPADALWTDPPYGVSYQVGLTKEKARKLHRRTDGKVVGGDTLDEQGLERLLAESFACADRVLKPGAAVYVCEPPGPLSIIFRVGFRAAGWRFHETLVWVKDALVMGHSDYHLRHETIIFGYTAAGQGRRGRGAGGWYGDNARNSVFEVPRPRASKDHPTTKPSALVAAMLVNSAPYRGVVVDCFAGAGCTVLACEELGRRARAMELDPRYATVILDRWEKQTGERGVLLARAEGVGTPHASPRPPRAPRGATVHEERIVESVPALAAPA